VHSAVSITSLVTALILSAIVSYLGYFKGIYHYTDMINHYIFPLFFFYVSLEARREIISEKGELRGAKAIQPLIMAIGGVLVPMGIFAWIYPQGFTPEGGMFIPIATDIAFVVLSITFTNMSKRLKTTLLAVAIADDIIGIGFLAVCFENWELTKVLIMVIILQFVVICNLLQDKIDSFRITKEVSFWLVVYCIFVFIFHKLHIHTTVAGVITALLVPYKPGAKRMEKSKNPKDSIYHLLEEKFLSLTCSWLVIPTFIILNVKIPMSELSMNDLVSVPSLAIAFGLYLGKPIGIFITGLLTAIIFGLPANNKKELFGGGTLCGIGFTVSLFFATLSSGIPAGISTIAIIAGSFASAISGIMIVRYANNQTIIPSFRKKVKKAN
jgi:NhaA family Na+:H+ antiporter